MTYIDRDEAIKRIRTALKRKTGKTWSVTGDRGTAWGWIRVQAPPKRRIWHEAKGDPSDPAWLNIPWNERIREVPPTDEQRPWAYTPMAECRELARAFRLPNLPYGVHHQGLLISPDEREWYVLRIEQ